MADSHISGTETARLIGYLRDADGTGSLFGCAATDPGAMAVFLHPVTLPSFPLFEEGSTCPQCKGSTMFSAAGGKGAMCSFECIGQAAPSPLGEGLVDASRDVEDVVHDILIGVTSLKGVPGTELDRIAKDIGAQFAGKIIAAPSPLREEMVTDEMVEAALHAVVPGGAEVWNWLPQETAWEPHQTARDVMRAALTAALNASATPSIGEIEELRKALEPFAREAENYDYGDGSGPALVEEPDASSLHEITDITVGDLRRARAVLATQETNNVV